MNNPTNIPGYIADLTPHRAIAEDANCAVIMRNGAGDTGPQFTVHIGRKTPGTPAIPGTPAVPQQSGPGLPNYVPAQPAKPEQPATPDSFVPHRSEQLVLTQAEWDNWDKTVSDEAYIRGIAAARFALPLA